MNSATKVGEIFIAAGEAFNRLGDLTMQLHPNGESPTGKWTDEEIDLLLSSITRFSEDLNKISFSIKNRTVSQIRQALKKKAFEDAGIPAKQVPAQQVQNVMQISQPKMIQQQVKQQQQLHTVEQQTLQSTMNSGPTLSHQTHKPQTVHIQHVQHIVPLPITQQHQQLQTPTKQIIIANPTTPTSQQTQPQIVHLQTQQLQAPQIIQTQQTTTMTLAQFQQLQQQKALAAQANVTSTVVSGLPTTQVSTPIKTPSTTPGTTATVTENIIIQKAHNQSIQQLPLVTTQQSIVPVNVTNIAPNPPSLVPATTLATTQLKSGPDVRMTLNRINVQENEVDPEECLPADVVKLDFSSEEVAG